MERSADDESKVSAEPTGGGPPLALGRREPVVRATRLEPVVAGADNPGGGGGIDMVEDGATDGSVKLRAVVRPPKPGGGRDAAMARWRNGWMRLLDALATLGAGRCREDSPLQACSCGLLSIWGSGPR